MPFTPAFKKQIGFKVTANPKKIAKLQKQVNKLSKPEAHYITIANANYVLDGTGAINLLNTVAQGVSDQQRVGKKFKMDRLVFTGLISNNAAATSNDVRWSIVYDKKPTGSLPAITDIYDGVGPQYLRKEDNSDRFIILREWNRVLLGNATTGNTNSYTQNIQFKLSINKDVINKSAGTGAIGDLEKGALYLITVGNQTAGTSAALIQGAFRLYFHDM